MEIASVIKAAVLPALLISLTACGESNEVYEESNAGNALTSASGINETEPEGSDLSADGFESDVTTNEMVDTTQITTDSAGTDTVTTTEDSEAEDAGAPDTTTESQPTVEPAGNTLGPPTPGVPQFVTSACGSLPISTAVQSNTRSAPTAMTTGQLVSGIIKSGPDNIEHYWSVALEPGDYHVVLDSKRVDGDFSSLGLRFSELHADGRISDLFSGNSEFDYRSRSHGFFTVVVARSLLLRLTPSFGAEDYTFGIFANGSAVPSPLFSDCPTIKPLSLDTVEALFLPEEGSSAGDRWYLANLTAGSYALNSWAARTDGSNSRVHYKITQADQFGQRDRTVEFGSVDEAGPVTNIDSAELIRDDSGPVWIRIQNLFTELSMEFTLNSGV